MHDDRIIAEFTQQAESFNLSPVAREAQTFDALVRAGAPSPEERWLEVARREAAAAGLDNATFRRTMPNPAAPTDD